MSRRLLVLCPHPEGVAPGQRLHYEQYLDDFRAAGWDVRVSPFMTRTFWDIAYQPGRWAAKVLWTLRGYAVRLTDLARLPFYDAAYVFLWVTPFGSTLFERLARTLSRRLIYDINDLVYLAQASSANQLIAWLKGPRKMFYLMATADHVVTCTPYLDGVVRERNPRTTCVPSTMDTRVYRPAGRYSNAGRLVIGWSGSHSTSRYLHLLDRVLLDLARELDFELLVIGDPSFVLEGVRVRAIPWNLATEVPDLQRIDIGLYPLPDELWVNGKGGGKSIQYMALGIPVLASAVGPNAGIIEDGVTGYLVRTPGDWAEGLRRLAADPELRRRLGTAGRARAERMFSLDAYRPVYLKILKDVCGG